MLVIGLTGGIGAGKSTVSRLLAERGGIVVDADVISREVVEPDGAAYQALVDRFGSEGVFDDDGRLNRAALAEIVFKDGDTLKDLNDIVHPAVGAVIAERLAEEASTDHVVILDVPLLVESGRNNTAAVLVVDCPPEEALRRAVARGLPEDDVRRRMANQVSREDRLAKADFVVDNGGPPEALAAEVDKAWAWIEGLRT